MSSDIRKWFMKPHDKNAGAPKPSGKADAAPAPKKPVLSIPEKPAPSSVSGNQDASARRKTSKYFAPKTEKDADVAEKSVSKRKQLEENSKPLASNKVPKDEEEEDDDFVAPSKKKTPVKPPPSKKLKAASNGDDEDERMDEDAKTPSKAAGRGRGRGRGGRGAAAAHAKTAPPDDDVDGGEDRMDEDAKTPSKAAGRGRGRGRGGRGGGTAHGKTTGLDDDGDEDRMDEDDKTPSKAAGRGRGGRGAGATPGGRGRGGGGRGFMNFGERKDPPHKGEKEVPEGAPDCLAGLTFVISGTLDSLEREEAADVIKRYGGRVTSAISKKTSYLLADEDVGGVKSNKAKDLGVPFLTEDGLFDMIRKSKPAKSPVNKDANNSNSEKLQKSQTKSSPVKVEKRAGEQVSTMDKIIASKSNKESASSNNQKAKVVDRGSLQWTEKYRPKVPNDIVGNQSMVKQLHDWLKTWEEQFLHPGQKGKGKKQTDGGAKKAVLLSGPPGIGKTTTAKVVSQMLGLQAIEVNASDSRGKADSKIEKGVGGSTSNSIKELISNDTLNYSDNRTKKPKAVLIMDEVDGMSAGDRGGVADLIASIKISKIPIVCICNDRYSQKLKSLVNYCLLLNFRKPTKQQMGKRLMEIARKEGVQAQENAMEELAERVHGDIRMALNHLQYMSLSQSVVKYDDIRLRLNSSAKDEDISPFTAVDKLFGFNGGRLRMDERINLSMSDPDLVPLIIQENYINYRPSDVGKDDNGVKRMNYLARAAESIADGDIVNVQIRRYRQWQLSQAASFASSIVPAALMHGNREVFEAGERNFNRFGGWLGKYSTANKNKRLPEDIHSHILASQQANVDRMDTDDATSAAAAAAAAVENANSLKRKSDDIGWAYGELVDPNNTQRVKCKFCNHIITGGIYRLKQHIAANTNAVKKCKKAPEEAKEACLKAFAATASKKQHKADHEKEVRDSVTVNASSTRQAQDDEDVTCIGSSEPHMLGPMDKWVRTIDPKLTGAARLQQMKINKAKWDERTLAAQEYIARWMYTHAIPFNAIDNDEFKQMCEAIGQFGPGLVPPSQYDLREPLLKSEYARTKTLLKDREEERMKNGCSLMTDAWTDMKRRSIMNLVTHCAEGVSFIKSHETSDVSHTSEMIFNMVAKAIDDLGAEHVVQVVTDNASNNMGAKNLLKVKKPNIFWSSCATHTVNLMLQGIGNLPKFKKILDQAKAFTIFVYGHHKTLECMRSFTKRREIIRPGVTRFASQFLTLQSMAEKAGALKRMVVSSKWEKIKVVQKKKGKDATATIMSIAFWKGVNLCIKVFEPLVKVLRLVDGDVRPSMGFVYGEIVKAKKEIKEAFGNVELRYKDVMAIVDKKMKHRLDAPLHMSAYLLNPHYSYADESIFESSQVTTGFMDCVETFFHGDDVTQDKVVNYEFPLFQKREGAFGKKLARTCQNFDYNPVAWWRMYGGETPNLQKMAIRILSLTSSASGCERNWSCFESIHTKRRNRLTTDRLDQLVNIQFNSRLLSKRRRIKERKNIDVLLSTDASEAQGFFYEGGDADAFVLFRDEDESGVDGTWNESAATEHLERRRSARVRDLHDEEFESDKEAEQEETDSEEEEIVYEDDEDDVVEGTTYMDED